MLVIFLCIAELQRCGSDIEGKVIQMKLDKVEAVSDLLGNKLNMRIAQFTSSESAEEREILKRFAEGKHVRALVAIRCLDEGVNIPSIKMAFILASSTNPKEYVQRRGRVLRKAPGKNTRSYMILSQCRDHRTRSNTCQGKKLEGTFHLSKRNGKDERLPSDSRKTHHV